MKPQNVFSESLKKSKQKFSCKYWGFCIRKFGCSMTWARYSLQIAKEWLSKALKIFSFKWGNRKSTSSMVNSVCTSLANPNSYLNQESQIKVILKFCISQFKTKWTRDRFCFRLQSNQQIWKIIDNLWLLHSICFYLP